MLHFLFFPPFIRSESLDIENFRIWPSNATVVSIRASLTVLTEKSIPEALRSSQPSLQWMKKGAAGDLYRARTVGSACIGIRGFILCKHQITLHTFSRLFRNKEVSDCFLKWASVLQAMLKNDTGGSASKKLLCLSKIADPIALEVIFVSFALSSLPFEQNILSVLTCYHPLVTGLPFRVRWLPGFSQLLQEELGWVLWLGCGLVTCSVIMIFQNLLCMDPGRGLCVAWTANYSWVQ